MNQEGTVLILDVNKGLVTALKILLSKSFKNVITANGNANIKEIITTHNVDVVIIDLSVSSVEINTLIEIDSLLEIIVLVTFSDVKLAMDAIGKGAYDFILKPWNNDKVTISTINAYRTRLYKKEINEIEALKESIQKREDFYWGISNRMKTLYSSIHKIASNNNHIIITGEYGTGKKRLAHEIHSLSLRNKEIVVSIDAKSISSQEFKEELLGYKKGSTENAITDKLGKLYLAKNGSLIIENIESLSLDNQKLLVEILNSKKYNQIGATTASITNIRIIATSTLKLKNIISLESSYYPLYKHFNIATEVTMPSLQERRDDILPLATMLLNNYNEKYNKKILGFTELCKEVLIGYSWRGNISELSATIKRSVFIAEEGYIHPGMILLNSNSSNSTNINDIKKIIPLEEMEAIAIKNALKKSKGNITKAAELLKVTRQTLYNKAKRYNLFK